MNRNLILIALFALSTLFVACGGLVNSEPTPNPAARSTPLLDLQQRTFASSGSGPDADITLYAAASSLPLQWEDKDLGLTVDLTHLWLRISVEGGDNKTSMIKFLGTLEINEDPMYEDEFTDFECEADVYVDEYQDYWFLADCGLTINIESTPTFVPILEVLFQIGEAEGELIFLDENGAQASGTSVEDVVTRFEKPVYIN